MLEENIFKTAALGFNKTDVINYIKELKVKESRLAVRVDELEKQLSIQNETDTSEYDTQIDTLSRQVNDCCTLLVERERELEEKEAALAEKERDYNELLRVYEECKNKYETSGRSVEAIQNKIISLEQALNKNERTVEYYKEQLVSYENQAADFKKKNDEYEAELQALHSSSEKLRVLETQLGSSIIDARRYADRIISDARSKATTISSEVYIAVNQTTTKVNGLAEDMQIFTSNFYESMNVLKSRLDNLAHNLDEVALELIGKAEKTASPEEVKEEE